MNKHMNLNPSILCSNPKFVMDSICAYKKRVFFPVPQVLFSISGIFPCNIV